MTMIQRSSFTLIANASYSKAFVRQLSALVVAGGRTGTQHQHWNNALLSSVCGSASPRFMGTASFYRPTITTKMSDTSSLPYHLVVGLPALSPTMEVGTLSEWYKNEGDTFHAGDGLAKIETDKAAIDFEAQDDGVVAKILISASDGTDSYVYICKLQWDHDCFFLFHRTHTVNASLLGVLTIMCFIKHQSHQYIIQSRLVHPL